jgi:RNA polymerase sigma-70 factor (ECF subfamily)
VFIKAYINIHRFDAGQRFSLWIYRIAHNEMVNHVKKKKSLPFSWFEPDVLVPFLQSSTEETTLLESDRAYEKERIEKILDKIPITHREILTLYFYEELSYKEISDVLHIPVATVGVRLTRAKKQVEQLLQTPNA